MAKNSTVKKSTVSAKSSAKSVKKTSLKSVPKTASRKTTVTKPAAKKGASSSASRMKVAKPAAKKPAPKAVNKAKTSIKLPSAQNLKTVAKPVAKPLVMAKPAFQPAPAVVKPLVLAAKSTYDFKVSDHLVYPTHGVGHVTAIEKTEIAGTSVTLYVLNFEKEKMTLRVPVTRAASVGLRRLSSSEQITKALSVLKGKPKTARGMWSRRAAEYGQKINSGNIESIAQVVRDLHKNVDDPDRSYSERVIYESAFDRLCGEYAAVNKIDTKQAQEILVKALNKKAA